jgi:hypothetical protein
MSVPNTADIQRVYRVYHYLCSCLGIVRSKDGSPNYRQVSKRLSETRDLRRTVSLLFKGKDAWIGSQADSSRHSSLTTGNLVDMLSQLNTSLQDDYRNYDEPYTRVLTASDFITALYQLVELTPEERNGLGLLAGDGLTLLQQALLIFQITGNLENYEMLLHIYKAAVGMDFSNAEPALDNLTQVDRLIEQTVRRTLNYLPERRQPTNQYNGLSQPSREKTITELAHKAQREIRRLLARSGNQQGPMVGSTVVNSYIHKYLQPAFVTKLAQTVVANERLTDEFPVYLKRLTIEASGPLPFADKELGVLPADGPYPPLLHPALRRLDRGEGNSFDDLPGPGDYELASQEATRVIAEFYVKVPEGYTPAVNRVFKRLASQNQQRIDFSLSSTGIGGALSHVIKVINRALLRDIPCLSNYFPIAHDVTSTQSIIRDNVASPIWAHSLVKLCDKQTVGQAILASGPDNLRFYEEFSFAEPIGHGDYCGFDFVIAQAQAALQARLQAVRNAGTFPQEYITHLCHRTERTIALQDAWSYLQGYPFSCLAMVGAIEREILKPHVGNQPLEKNAPYIYFDACLSIVEALLDEGSYRLAKRYLNQLEVLESTVQQGLDVASRPLSADLTNCGIFSGELTVRYLLVLATYCYMYDLEDNDPAYLPPGCNADVNREGLIRRAWVKLDEAQQYVWLRLRKYVLINEVSQGTFHPHYLLLARIYFLRMKLLLFFPRFVPRQERGLPTDRFSGQQRTIPSIHWGRLYLAEKARLYAAADGDSEIYACYASMQCWLHLIAAYTDQNNLTLPVNSTQNYVESLPREKSLEWARKLRDHALISYAEKGRYYYNQIKEKSGVPGQSENFGPYSIQKLTAIFEAREQQYEEWSAELKRYLILDMSLMAVSSDDLPKMSPNHPDRNIYLFGTNACYLFFARGLYLLCSNSTHEFGQAEMASEPIDWEQKLYRAMRLLNMAWAMAEEGGTIEQKEDADGEVQLHIIRNSNSQDGEGYLSPDVESVRDMYPRRINEIAVLGKIFAAACIVLRLRVTPTAEWSELQRDMQALLTNLHNARRFTPTLQALLDGQPQYNGHLEPYLQRASTILNDHGAAATQPDSPSANLHNCRDTLLQDLFEALLQ